jgi:hypothetical protein|tara:strand:+ start:60 stop:257 length:198 start_codon:yes stop_codon:yes gene_type:complete
MAHSLYHNIELKRKRIAAGSGEKMRSPGDEGAPSDKDFKEAAKTSKSAKRKRLRKRAKRIYKNKG